MTKLYEVQVPKTWVNLNTLVKGTVTGVIELFNAGENGAAIQWTESAAIPVAGAFYRVLGLQAGTVFTVGSQPIWVQSPLQKAKLMVSQVNTATVSVKGTI